MRPKTIIVETEKPDCCFTWVSSGWEEGFILNYEVGGIGYYAPYGYGIGSGLYFRNVVIPPKSAIVEACLIWQAFAPKETEGVRSFIMAELNPSPQPFSTFEDFYYRNWTGIYVDYDNVPPIEQEKWYETIDFSPVIQELVNLPNWQAGNSMAILWADFDDRSDHQDKCARGFNTPYARTPVPVKLKISFLPGGLARTYQISHPALMSIKTVEHTKEGDIETTHLSGGSSLAERRLTTSKEITITPPAEVEVTTLPGLKYTREIR